MPNDYIDGLDFLGTEIDIQDAQARQDILAINSVMGRSAKLLASDSDADLDVADEDGNVLVRLADGEILTKNFNSAETLKTADAERFAGVLAPESGAADLYVADQYGDVVVKFADGGVETKRFRGFQYMTFQSAAATYTGQAVTLTVTHPFRKGDRIVLHVERGAKPWDRGAVVSYAAGNIPIKTNWRGDCGWIEFYVPQDVDAITASYGAGATGLTSGTALRLEVSLLGDIPVRPTVVRIKADGSGDYATLKAALDAIGTKANSVLNPYRIEIWPGTYDTLAGYTDTEIRSADIGGGYSQTSFVGPKLLDGIDLIGIGTADEIILTAGLSTSDYSADIRGNISTLNIQGTSTIENLTIKATDLRYCIHDDFYQPDGIVKKRVVRNCIFRGYSVAYTPCTTYGAGSSVGGGDYLFENVDFGDNGGLHTMESLANTVRAKLVHCKGHGFRIGDNETSSPVAHYSIYTFIDCDFDWIHQNMAGSAPHVIVRGCGGKSPFYMLNAQTEFDTGDTVYIPNRDKLYTGGVGTVLERTTGSHGPRWQNAASAETAQGVVVYQNSEYSLVQTRGYLQINRTGISSFSVGDYVGLVNGEAGIVANEADSFGQIVYPGTTTAQIHLKWRM